MNLVGKTSKMLAARARLPVKKFITYSVRRSSQLNDKELTIKRFKPSLDTKAGEVVTETIEQPAVNVVQRMREERKAEKENKLKTRKLNWLDKRILVRLGKYKRIEDVPDKIVYKSIKAGQEAKNEVRSFLTEKTFRTVMFTDYMLTICCAGLLLLVYFVYSNSKSSENSETKE
uniref:VGLUT vesicular glutamate transporter n=1 Tax=Phallusia mammillata TaxID=59560 RepID=A0A6F9DBQ6_9ASCI|nr:VGLUT vesicular glutamate transporter [Phallusia mammillata]